MIGEQEIYEFGEFRVNATEHTFERSDGKQNGTLPEKAFQTLVYLVRNRGHLVTKDELLKAVWPDVIVEENNLEKAIHLIRQTLGERPGEHRYIETVRKHGYRFVAEVRTVGAAGGKAGTVGPRRPGTAYIGAAAGLSLVILLVFAAFHYGRGPGAQRFDLSDIRRLTSNDRSSHPAISPDGKFAAYVLKGPERLSVRLLQIDTNDTSTLYEAAQGVDLGMVRFSPDGSYIYFLQVENSIGILYRIGLLARSPQPVLAELAYYALSADGRIAFVRNSADSMILIADPDGSDARLAASRSLTEPFSYLDWAPDGSKIAASVGSREQSGERMFPVEISISTGEQSELTARRWQYLSHIFWLADGTGLIANGIERGSQTGAAWFIAYPGGETSLLAELPSVYTITGQSADSKHLIAQTVELRSNIWIAELGENGAFGPPRQLTSGNDGGYVTFMTDGRLLFTSSLVRPSMRDVFIMNTDGTDRRQLTDGSSGSNNVPIATPDGRYVVFESDRSGRSNIWRMNIDGSDPVQLTSGSNEKGPAVSPDGKWVYFRSPDDTTIRKVSISGGESIVVAHKNWHSCIVSPEGKMLLSSYREPGRSGWQYGLLNADTGEKVRLFQFPDNVEPGMSYQFLSDGDAFIYTASQNGEWNIWKQPIEGGPAVRITDLRSNEEVHSPSISRDGRRLVFNRGGWTTDAFLIRHFQR